MSVTHCFKCDLDYDTDFFTECPCGHDSDQAWQCDYCGEMRKSVHTFTSEIMGDVTVCDECRMFPEKRRPS